MSTKYKIKSLFSYFKSCKFLDVTVKLLTESSRKAKSGKGGMFHQCHPFSYPTSLAMNIMRVPVVAVILAMATATK